MESIWNEGLIRQSFPVLEADQNTDVLVIGGGLAGVLCAYWLKQAGVDCILAEASSIGSGATENTTAKITAQHGLIYAKLIRQFGTRLAGLYLRANEQAVEQYRQLCQQIDCDFEVADSYVYAQNDRSPLDKEQKALAQLGFSAELVTQTSLPFPVDGAIRFPCQAQFHPLKFLLAISQGLPLYEHTPVQELIGTTAVTRHGRIQAKKIIVATHYPFLNKHGSYFLKLYQQRSYVLALKGADLPDGMYLDAVENGLSFRRYGDTLLLGGGGHRTGKKGGGWAFLRDFAASQYPHAHEVAHWATQDCMSLDGVPYIGAYSASTEGLFVATGFHKWGMTTSMVAARLLTNLVQEKTDPLAELFSPSRSILRPQLAVNAMEAACGLLAPTAKRCPHLGCGLKWNEAEQSWDCPCHGSRFTANGKLINNPATGDLK